MIVDININKSAYDKIKDKIKSTTELHKEKLINTLVKLGFKDVEFK